MKKSVRVAVGCLSILVVLLILGLAIWWVPREPVGPPQNYGEGSPPAVR